MSNMIEAISCIVDDTGRNGIAVITCSGHGSWIQGENDDEMIGTKADFKGEKGYIQRC